MDGNLKTLRNLAIVLLLATAVDFLPGGSRAADTVGTVIGVVFMAGLGWAAVWLYRQHRVGVYGLGDQRRGLLYGALGLGVLTVAGKPRMWETGFGELLWFVVIGLVAYTLLALYRYSRSY
ncbi:MAG TPA: hypothetical protein VMU32_11445 [Solirubrobacteraceae bacterium]|nr:hypothetical protein [Solirubrobacteraceae bacterium]